MLDSYPAVRRHLDLAALEPRYFESGAILADDGPTLDVADPLPASGGPAGKRVRRHVPIGDKVRLAALGGGDCW